MKPTLSDEIQQQKTRPVFLVMTGPIGAGKDTLFSELQKRNPQICRIITTTSREMREGESQGNPLYFISKQEFEEKIAQGGFFEWVEFRDALKGTQKKTVDDALAKGQDIIWHIEARGIKNVKQKIKTLPIRSVFVYLTALSIDILKSRVFKTHPEDAQIRWNENLVKWSQEQYDDCEYVVVNEEGRLDETVKKVESIVEAKRMEIT